MISDRPTAFLLLTWPKNDRIPKHDIIWTWAARDATRRVARKTLEIADKASSAVGRLSKREYSVLGMRKTQDD
jgi:hypothetical protein